MSRVYLTAGGAFVAEIDDQSLLDAIEGGAWRGRVIRPLLDEADRLGESIEVRAVGGVLLDVVDPRGKSPQVVGSPDRYVDEEINR